MQVCCFVSKADILHDLTKPISYKYLDVYDGRNPHVSGKAAYATAGMIFEQPRAGYF